MTYTPRIDGERVCLYGDEIRGIVLSGFAKIQRLLLFPITFYRA
jgi:hypothetical protein